MVKHRGSFYCGVFQQVLQRQKNHQEPGEAVLAHQKVHTHIIVSTCGTSIVFANTPVTDCASMIWPLYFSQVDVLGHNCINLAASRFYAGEIKQAEKDLYPGGSAEAYLKMRREGKHPCRQLNTITRVSSIRSRVSPLPRNALVNAEHQV